jgi:hypothetical protein
MLHLGLVSAKPAVALGRGRPLEIPPLHLGEADGVADALKRATALFRERRHQRTHDVFTGLPKRALFSELVNKSIAVCERIGPHFSVMSIDLDGVKSVKRHPWSRAGRQAAVWVGYPAQCPATTRRYGSQIWRRQVAVVLVVSGPKPNRTHIRIVVAICKQQNSHQSVSRQCHETNLAHGRAPDFVVTAQTYAGNPLSQLANKITGIHADS